MTAQVAADLRAAADVLRRDGWTQGKYHDKATGCHCALGAVAVVVGRGAFPNPSRWQTDSSPWARRSEAATTRLQELLGLRFAVDVVGWNDADEQTADEVIAALEAAADAAEATS